jgi:hypothetical protein
MGAMLRQELAAMQRNTNSHDITAPATDEAKQWDGWGTALKPALSSSLSAASH